MELRDHNPVAKIILGYEENVLNDLVYFESEYCFCLIMWEHESKEEAQASEIEEVQWMIDRFRKGEVIM